MSSTLRVGAVVCAFLGFQDIGSAQGRPENAATAPPYTFHILQFGNTYQGFRLKSATGETWQLTAGKWVAVPEAGSLTGGKYEMLLVPTNKNLAAFRFESTSGAIWMMQQRRWTRLDEPATAGKVPAGTTFRWRQLLLGDTLQILRFNPGTGESATLVGGQLQSIPEAEALRRGDYEVVLVGAGESWMAIRTDRVSGQGWLLRNNQWHKVDDSE